MDNIKATDPGEGERVVEDSWRKRGDGTKVLKKKEIKEKRERKKLFWGESIKRLGILF